MGQTLDIVSNGIPFRVRILISGDRYGLNEALTLDGQPQVEFYDRRYMHTRHGQFVTRYYVSTILDSAFGFGLVLQGDVPSWRVEAAEMAQVKEWLKLNVGPALKLDHTKFTGLYQSDVVLPGTPVMIEKGYCGVVENRTVAGQTYVKVTHQYRPTSGAYEAVENRFATIANQHLLYERDGIGPV